MNKPRKQTNRLTQKQYRQVQDCIIDHSVEDEEGKRSVASSFIGFVPTAIAALGFQVSPQQISKSADIVDVSFDAPVASKNTGKGLKPRIAKIERFLERYDEWKKFEVEADDEA